MAAAALKADLSVGMTCGTPRLSGRSADSSLSLWAAKLLWNPSGQLCLVSSRPFSWKSLLLVLGR